MREHKYKAWHKGHKVMTIPMTLAFIAKEDVHWKLQGYVDEYEWLEFTDLKDKNAKEIFEGDILLIEDEEYTMRLDDGSGPLEPANHLAPVVFQEGSFGVSILESGCVYKQGFWSFPMIKDNIGDMAYEMEIIGNIYMNPELVKV